MSLAAERLRGVALSHRDWLMADGGRTRFTDALYISERLMGYSTLAIEAVF